MTEQTAEIIWLSFVVYFGVGLLVALPTLVLGLRRLDPGSGGMPLRVRLLIAPGIAALWPLVLARIFGLRAKEDRP